MGTMREAELFKQHILERGILDPVGIHHEFASGMHGRKLDFDLIPDDDPLYAEWVALNVQAIRMSGSLALAVVGVANGTNRLARDVGSALGIEGLATRKVSSREVRLTPEAHSWLAEHALEGTVVILEDVGTTGGTARTGVMDIQATGIDRVEGLFTWQRADSLPAFEAAGIPYSSIIHEPLPTLAPEACRAEGYCAQGWQFITHS